MREQELLAMSQKERDRLKVLAEARRKHITPGQAAARVETAMFNVC